MQKSAVMPRFFGDCVESVQLCAFSRETFVAMHLQFFFVAHDLAIETIGELIDGGVQILVFASRMNVAPAHMHIGFHFLSELFHRHDDIDIDHMIEVSVHAIELRNNVGAKRVGNGNVVSSDVQIHETTSTKKSRQKSVSREARRRNVETAKSKELNAYAG
jgi:hypothetical protein